MEATFLHELVTVAACRAHASVALTCGDQSQSYGALCASITAFASGLRERGLNRSGRVAVYLEKLVETVVAMIGAAAAGGVFVPIKPLLKADQVAYILR